MNPWRPWLLGAATALLVVRPLLPSEGAAVYGDGLPVVMLWLALVVGWLLIAVGRPQLALRWHPIDAAVLALVGWHTVAGIVGAASGAPRPALNMLWEWIGLGLAYFCVRQFCVDGRGARALVAVMIGVATALSALGLYQYFVEVPAMQAAYAADPEGMMRQAGVWYPAGAPQRELFEARLRSPEPAATFALSTSLAGYLVPWLLLLVAAMAQAISASRRSWSELAGLGIAILLIVVCLAVTNSRSGYVAAAVGLALVGAAAWRGRELRWRIWLVTATLALAVLLVAAVGTGLFDGPIAVGARKSLGDRLEYWRATMRLIADRPWFGCGPGNFQDVYTLYKLPEAGEEVADPHNFFLEVWATAGTPASAALALVLVGLLIQGVRRRADTAALAEAASPVAAPEARAKRRRKRARDDAAAKRDEPPRAAWQARHVVCMGGLAGFALFVPLSALSAAPPNLASVWAVLPVAALCVAALWRWIDAGTLSPLGLLVAMAALLVNLLATGGMGYPAVAGSLWLLAALVVGATGQGRGPGEDGSEDSPRRDVPVGFFDQRVLLLPWWVAGVALAGFVALAAACYFTAYQPVLASQAKMRTAQRAMAERRLGEAVALLQAAAAADPWAYEPRRQVAEVALGQWLVVPDRQTLRQFAEATRESLERAGSSSLAWQLAGDHYYAIAMARDGEGKQREPTAAKDAVNAYQRAVELYPTSALTRGKLAIALALAGQRQRAMEEAAEARRQDMLTPHADKKLPAPLRRELDAISSVAP